ncbi:MAG: hypothetical protein VXA26_11230 [Candidatus Neomarinimicrobiota bacterium]|jgi:hypothetical protein
MSNISQKSYMTFLQELYLKQTIQIEKEHILDLMFDEIDRIKKNKDQLEIRNALAILKSIHKRDYEQA